MSTTFEMNVGL